MGWVKPKFAGGGLLLGIMRQGEEKEERVKTQKMNRTRRAGLVFLAVVLCGRTSVPMSSNENW